MDWVAAIHDGTYRMTCILIGLSGTPVAGVVLILKDDCATPKSKASFNA